MRVKVDMESNALYFRLSEEEIVESEETSTGKSWIFHRYLEFLQNSETSSGVILDYDKDGRVVGIEILNIKNQFSIEDLSNMKVELPTTKAG